MIPDQYKIFIPGRGSVSSSIVIVGEAPAKVEIEQLKCFAGPTGSLLMDMLSTVGIDRNEVYFTNAIKYMLGPSKDQYGRRLSPETRCDMIGQKWSEQVELLGNEIEALNPTVIIALGGTALQALCKKPFNTISQWRGSVIPGMGRKVVPTYHPAGVLHQANAEEAKYWMKNVIEFDLIRAKKQAQFPEFRYPPRLLQICTSVRDLEDFLRQHEGEEYVAEDIEALKCVPVCLGISFIPSRGMSIPLWGNTEYCKISELDRSELVKIWTILDKLNYGKTKKIGHNFKYDQDKIRRLGFGMRNFYADTMLMASCADPELPKSLEFNTSLYTEEPYYKDEGGEFNHHKHPISQLLYYNARDACVTREIKDGLDGQLNELGMASFYYNFYHQSHDLFSAIENYGIRIDEDARRELCLKYVTWEYRLKSDLHNLVGHDVNPNSWQQVGKLLYEDFKLPFRKGTGEEILTALLANNAKNPKHVQAINLILETRRVKKANGTYILASPDSDGRARTSYFICGTETGRRSTQILKPPIRPVKCGVAWHTLTKHGDIGSDIRRMYIPDPGLVFLQADQSQAEARIVALLCRDFDLLGSFEKIDVHALMASYIFGGEWFDHSKQKHGHETPERFMGKTSKHGTNYDMKKHTLMETINTDARKFGIPVNISEWKAGKILEILHEKNPKIRGVFHKEIQDLAGGRILCNPFGRKRIFYEKMGDDLFKEMYAQIPQSTVADNTLSGMLKVRNKYPKNVIICGESHDAFLMQVDKQEAEDLGPRIKEDLEVEIDFDKCSLPRGKLTIPWDLEIGENYKDLSKLKIGVKV